MALSSRFSSRSALPATRARQGSLGRDIFWVLVISTLLAALALFAAWTWRAGDLASTEPTTARKAENAQHFAAPAPAPASQPAQPAAGR
jgi:hypothetical protein